MRKFSLFFMATISFLSMNSLIYSQASLEGRVKETAAGESLIGANVFLVGTGFGASTDIEGRYLIKNVPVGKYTIRVSYLGYKTIEQKIDLNVEEKYKIDFKLMPQVIEGNTVIVTGQAQGQMSAINQKLATMSVMDVVSSDRIQELPDANAAESVGRLPGMSVLRSGGEGQQVVVRGLQPKYNNITVNGIKMASTNATDRSVDISVISSEMLDGIEVTKTVTPDQDADVIGGTINFRMREAKSSEEGFGLNITGQGAYNGLSDAYNKLNNYKYVVSIENRFIENEFGVLAQVDWERRNLSSNELGASYAPYNNNFTDYLITGLTLSDIPRDRKRVNGVLVLDYKQPEGVKIVLSNFVSSGTTQTNNRSEVYNVSASLNSRNFNFGYSNSTVNIITNTLTVEDNLSIFHAVGKLSHTYSETKNPYDWNFQFTQPSANLAQFASKSNITPQSVPNAANTDISQTTLTGVGSTNNFSKERALTVSIDFDTPVNLSDYITSVFKFGGKYRSQARSNRSEQYTGQGFGLAGSAFVTGLIEDQVLPEAKPYGTSIPMSYFQDPNFEYGKFLNGDYQMFYPLNVGLMNRVSNLLHDNADFIAANNGKIAYGYNNIASRMNYYDGNEIQNAFYLMEDIKIGNEFSMIAGVRFQELRTKYTGYQGIEPQIFYDDFTSLYDTTVSHVYPYWLPDIIMKYQPFSWFDVRLSYTNTISYQDYYAIVPKIDVTLSNAIIYNNDNLKPTRSNNIDGYFSFHHNSIGLFTVGLFMKKIDDLIYPWTFHKSGLDVYAYYPQRYIGTATNLSANITTQVNNPYRSDLYGMELDWQTRFWYLPDPFSNLILNVNYTHTSSKTKYPYTLIIARGSGRGATLEFVDTSFTSRLITQPNDIFNLSVGYDYKGFSIRVSMLYTSDIFTGPSTWPQIATSTSTYKRWDISTKQDLPFPGLQIYLNVSNLNGAYDRSVIAASSDVPASEQQYGLTAELGFRWQLN